MLRSVGRSSTTSGSWPLGPRSSRTPRRASSCSSPPTAIWCRTASSPPTATPRTAVVSTGEHRVKALLDPVPNTPPWNHTAVIITYDENGGFWDHVAPSVVDRWGPGSRVPTIGISPFARKGFVDHRRYDTTSILALIEHRWGLAPLTSPDADADPLSRAFDFIP